MRQRAISSVGVVLIVIVPALLGSPIFTITIAFIALGALYELYRAFQRVEVEPSMWTATVALIALIVIAGTDAPFLALMGTITAYTIISLAQHLLKTDISGSLRDWTFSLSGLMLVGTTMMHFILIRRIQGPSDSSWITDIDNLIGDGGAALGLAWLLTAIITTWLTDVCAYMFGRKWGKTKLIEHVSPNKTREGAAAGLAGGMITCAITGWIFGVPVPIWILLLVGLLLAAGAMIGDLCESLIKRDIGIKDMGTIIPGHGGILDRVDALLVTIPLAYYLAVFLDWRGWP